MTGLRRCTIPEGPECRRITDNLAKFSTGKIITAITPLSGRYLKKPIEGLSTVNLPAKVEGWGVKGKFIFAALDGDQFIWNTLGMSGSWKTERSSHARVMIEFQDGDVLYFTDARNFGTFKLVQGKDETVKKLDTLGPDMLFEDVPDDVFAKRLMKMKNKTVCEAIMSQSVISGVGNYLKADSLWLAKISPHRKVSHLSSMELSTLNASIKKVIRASYQSGGATIKSYSDMNGTVGQYSERFLVYSRDTDMHGNKVLREETPDGRTTHWCPDIQT